jgi:hypothetical protein
MKKLGSKKLLIMILAGVIVIAGVVVGVQLLKSGTTQTKQADLTDAQADFILDGYPTDTVPIYKCSDIESMLFFVNDDPNGFAMLYGGQVNYYNVVFYTTANQSDFIKYYRSLMSDIDEDYSGDSSVEGTIGTYYVSASKYSDDNDYAYLQVFLPENEYQKENRFYSDYPALFEVGENWIEHESTYGKRNQSGGEIEYTLYYTYADDMTAVKDEYIQKYSDKTDFQTDGDDVSWTDGNYEINLNFSADHGRIYVMIRTPMSL